MAREDQMAGKIKQAKGKVNEVLGAAKGDRSQEAKGKLQRGVGKVQDAIGRATSKPVGRNRTTTTRTTTTRRSGSR